MDGFGRNRWVAPLVSFEGSAAHRSSPMKIVAFAIIAVMMAYVICHNERFLIDPTNPVWQHYKAIGW